MKAKRFLNISSLFIAALVMAACGGGGGSASGGGGGGGGLGLAPLSIMTHSGGATSPDGTWTLVCTTNPFTGFDERETVTISVNDYNSTKDEFLTTNASCGGAPFPTNSFILSVTAGDVAAAWGDGNTAVGVPNAADGNPMPGGAMATKIAIAVLLFGSDLWFIDDSSPPWRLYRGDPDGCVLDNFFPTCLFAPLFLTKQ